MTKEEFKKSFTYNRLKMMLTSTLFGSVIGIITAVLSLIFYNPPIALMGGALFILLSIFCIVFLHKITSIQKNIEQYIIHTGKYASYKKRNGLFLVTVEYQEEKEIITKKTGYYLKANDVYEIQKSKIYIAVKENSEEALIIRLETI